MDPTTNTGVCPHCGCILAKKTLLAHKRLYYDQESDTWVKKSRHDDEFDMDDFAFADVDIDHQTPDENESKSSSPPPIVNFDPSAIQEAETELTEPDLVPENSDPSVCEDRSSDLPDNVEIWDEDKFEELFDPTQVQTFKPSPETHYIVKWICNFLMHLQGKHYIPDRGISLLLLFLAALFSVLSKLAPQLSALSHQFPTSIYKMHQVISSHITFDRYVVCQKCYSTYERAECITKNGTKEVSRLCSHRNHNHGRICRTVLLKHVELRDQRQVLHPFKTYCYASLINYLTILLNRPDFIDKCNHWKSLKSKDGEYNDVYDGRVWKDFLVFNGKPFLTEPFTFGLMLNIDWFKPCKHIEYSIGAIYLTVINLPRDIRFRREYVLLIGLIPGPHEPKHNINSQLEPLVKELLKLWEGVLISVNSLRKQVLVRCALLCVACDVPASRKVCGFLGHSAVLGCSKCMKKFPGAVGNRDYSGFEKSNWVLCNNSQHRRNVEQIKEASTVTQQNNVQSKFGCRYSILLELPYFDPVRMTIIDPMHNLFLGTAKRILKEGWIDKGLIKDVHLVKIQALVDEMQLPSYIGRIPHKIASSMSSFTADQFKSWTCFFSLICMKDILPIEHYRCWQSFVLAARLLCQMSITNEEIELADCLLLKFCRKSETLYQKQFITPNMHLHCHLKECILDFGPIHNFWLFSFERYNGMLENFPTNHHSIETQLMKKFLREFNVVLPSLDSMNEFEELDALIRKHFEPHLEGSLKVTIHGKYSKQHDLTSICNWSTSAIDSEFDLPNVYIRASLCDTALSQLQSVYSQLYHRSQININSLNVTYRKYTSLVYRGTYYNCIKKPVVYVREMNSLNPRAVILDYFMLHSLHHDSEVQEHLFLAVTWLQEHHDKTTVYGKPVEVWWKDLHDHSLEPFVPVQFLVCQTINCEVTHELQTVYAIVAEHNIRKLHPSC